MQRVTELTLEQTIAIIEDYFHRHGDHQARAKLCNFGCGFFTVEHKEQVSIINEKSTES